MAEHNSLNELFSDIADAIRAKSGSVSEIAADNFPGAISAIPESVKIYGPYGPYKAGDTVQLTAKQALLLGANPNSTAICIASDGSHYAAILSYDGTTCIFRRANTSVNAEFSMSLNGVTITSITGANELTWWRTVLNLPNS